MTEKISDNLFVTLEKKRLDRKEKWLSRLMLFMEDIIKVPLFRCQRCGECILSHTGFICSQRCPKRMRNGPCGGTSPDGYCEVYPDLRCIWYKIYQRSRMFGRLSLLYHLEKIHNWELEQTSAWLNVFTRRIDPPIWFIRKEKKR